MELEKGDLEVGNVWFLGDNSHVLGGLSMIALGTDDGNGKGKFKCRFNL